MARAFPQYLVCGLLALLPAACNQGSGGNASASAGASSASSGLPPTFGGIGAADAISPTEVVISWTPAVNANGSGGSELMRYRIYRNTDADAVQLEASFIHQTNPGTTSYVDSGLPDFSTLFYRVVAVDSAGRKSLSDSVSTARTPTTYGSSGVLYADIEDIWLTENAVGQNCLDCHDSGCDPNDLDTIPGNLDLSCFEGLMAGVGTTNAPDTFIIPSDGDATWNEFTTRFTQSLIHHADYLAVADNVLAMEPLMTDWADNGALVSPDASPPVFQFDNIANAGKYYGEFIDFQTAAVTFFHASDPESLPPDGNTEGQLEYLVFAGADSASIDWLAPVASIFSTNKLIPGNETMTVEFPWTGERVTIVVRALDASGRGVNLPPENDPNYLAALRDRWRNMSVNEREIQLVR